MVFPVVGSIVGLVIGGITGGKVGKHVTKKYFAKMEKLIFKVQYIAANKSYKMMLMMEKIDYMPKMHNH